MSFEHDLRLEFVIVKVLPDVLDHKPHHHFQYLFRIAFLEAAAEELLRCKVGVTLLLAKLKDRVEDLLDEAGAILVQSRD